jgi:hypothetical protein
MPYASLALTITDLPGQPPQDHLAISFLAGATRVEARFPPLPDSRFVLEGIPCRGAGQVFEVRIESTRFRPYRFFQMLREGSANTPADNEIRLAVQPHKVKSILAPPYLDLPETPARLLASAAMTTLAPEDLPWRGLRGGALWDALSSLQRACLLNLCAKAAHPSAGACAGYLSALLLARQDRCYAAVHPGLPAFLRASPRFQSAPGSLHVPLPGYLLEDSFKSRDPFANLQLTFMRHRATGALAADLDIDEASGVQHGFEVIRNRATKRRTNPYLVRELLLLAGGDERTIDPGYRFAF